MWERGEEGECCGGGEEVELEREILRQWVLVLEEGHGGVKELIGVVCEPNEQSAPPV